MKGHVSVNATTIQQQLRSLIFKVWRHLNNLIMLLSMDPLLLSSFYSSSANRRRSDTVIWLCVHKATRPDNNFEIGNVVIIIWRNSKELREKQVKRKHRRKRLDYFVFASGRSERPCPAHSCGSSRRNTRPLRPHRPHRKTCKIKKKYKNKGIKEAGACYLLLRSAVLDTYAMPSNESKMFKSVCELLAHISPSGDRRPSTWDISGRR